jgi:hypothetical protein
VSLGAQPELRVAHESFVIGETHIFPPRNPFGRFCATQLTTDPSFKPTP